MQIIGKIDVEKYKCVTEDIQTDEVIITDIVNVFNKFLFTANNLDFQR